MQPCDLVVVNYNAGAFLNDCITSVFAQKSILGTSGS